ncbi:glycoside hydrolase family 43 protein [Rouxiella badensis]|uniref:glycoside hydrolase family 43 protein n=1 Tax=Rouxiella badensis TaxID=1646377 RepID=UPI0003816A70|nr:glycoside hydrolase family 43 protein [Rouxiella badensis]MCC3704130.1 glycoside hydrolase family 43 protein [Rouxiella badensis]MCC3748045.1 glycoside hydrolase family 43 protein [Rouxiella badensis]
MKKLRLIALIISSIVMLEPALAAENLLTSDNDTNGNLINAHSGGVIYQNGTYYWYGEFRSPKPKNNTHWDSNQKVTIYKSKDMHNWQYVGIALDLSGAPENWDLERPKVIYNEKNKQYVMWFHLEPNRKFTEGLAGVAVSDSVTGPYHFIGASRPNKNVQPVQNDTQDSNNWFVKKANEKFTSYLPQGQQVRDLTAFVDDDKKAYLIYESEDDYSLQVVQLSDDYKSFTTKYSRILVGKQNEAPTITKANGKYFLITSGLTGYKPNPPRVAEADSILGPWKELGSPVVSNGKITSENLFQAQPSYLFFDPKSKRNILVMDQWDTSNGGFANLWKSTYVWLPVDVINGRPTVTN